MDRATAPGTGRTDSRLGATPVPSAEVQRKFGAFVEGMADPQETLDLVVDRPRLVLLKRTPKRYQVADDKVATADLLSDKEISVIGKSVGTTVLNLWFDDPTAEGGSTLLSYLVRVVPDPLARERLERVYRTLEEEVNKAFPDSHVTMNLVGEALFLRGEAKDAGDAARILRAVLANFPDAVAEIPVDRADVPASAGPAAGRSTGPVTPDVRDFLGAPRMGTTGSSPTPAPRAGRGRVTSIVNLLHVPGANQVMLRVTVAEVNRSAARSIGLNFSVNNSKGQSVFSNLTGALFSTANLPMILDNGQVSVALEALRTLSLAKSLAEPNLVALNGQSASFQAGGQFPVPVVTGATSTGLQGVQFIPFGVQVSFTPYITDRDRIRLQIGAEVSTRDASTGTTINGASVPALSTRNFQSTVDLRAGQTLAVAGLIQQNFGSSADRIPGPGDLPVLSWLLGSNQTSAAEQELVVLVTADFVEPLDRRKVPPLPGADLFEPSDTEFFLGGRLEGRGHEDFRSPIRTDWESLARYERLERTYLIGPTGHSDGRTGTAQPEGGQRGE